MNFPFPVTWLQFVKQDMKEQGTTLDVLLMWETLIHVSSPTEVKATAHLNKDYSYMALQNWVGLIVNQNENKEERRGENAERESAGFFSSSSRTDNSSGWVHFLSAGWMPELFWFNTK